MEVTASGAFLPAVWGPEPTGSCGLQLRAPTIHLNAGFVPLKRWSGKLFLWRSANPKNNPAAGRLSVKFLIIKPHIFHLLDVSSLKNTKNSDFHWNAAFKIRRISSQNLEIPEMLEKLMIKTRYNIRHLLPGSASCFQPVTFTPWPWKHLQNTNGRARDDQ